MVKTHKSSRPLGGTEPTPNGVGEAMVINDDAEVADPTPTVDWREVYLDWLVRQKLPTDQTEARGIM